MGGQKYLLHERTIQIEMQVFWEIDVDLNQSLFKKFGLQGLIKVECYVIITVYRVHFWRRHVREVVIIL